MTSQHAACACGQLELTATGEPHRISMCHCHDCQRRSGSVFAAQAWFPTTTVSIEGDSRTYCRIADSGNRITFHFCPSCGSTVFYRSDANQGATAVPVGAFADAEFPAPRVSVYEARMHPWVATPVDVEHIE